MLSQLQKCCVTKCKNKHVSRGYCGSHFSAYRKKGLLKLKNEPHNMTKTIEYSAWAKMKDRCYNENNANYKHYGGRGIKVCNSWKNSFMSFYADMGPRPSKIHSIDRIDNNGDYKPSNCRWATRKEQSVNRRNNVFIHHEGKSKTLPEWAKIKNINKNTLYSRINQRNWNIDRALSESIKKPQ